MNIFEALIQGKGRINEETMSSMLAFLLNPSQTHGIGDTFLRQFLNIVAGEIGNTNYFEEILRQDFIRGEVFLEERYDLDPKYIFDQKTRTIDVEIRLYKRDLDELIEMHRILIENKIRHGAAQVEQLKEEFIAARDAIIDDNEEIIITTIFLTPYGSQSQLMKEFDTLTQDELENHKKVWLRWHDVDNLENNITGIIRYTLERELRGEINPISEYVRHTLKAFAYYIESKVSPIVSERHFEIGTATERIEVVLRDGVYVLEKYTSDSIRIHNKETGEHLTVKPMLRRIIEELDLDVSLYRDEILLKTKNTRTLGRDVLEELTRRENL